MSRNWPLLTKGYELAAPLLLPLQWLLLFTITASGVQELANVCLGTSAQPNGAMAPIHHAESP